MENINTNPSNTSGRASARDFFLHLGAMVALYAVSISFLNLIFRIINKAFPEINYNIYAWGGGSEISLPVATLIVAFPLFILLSRLVYKIYEENPAKKELSIRKWLTYITLFVAGIILAGDLVTVIYKFLDGQDLTAAFLLKALAVVLVTGLIFIHYLQNIQDRVSIKYRKVYTLVTSCLLIITIVLGFAVMGSPKTQRLIRLDNQKISDLQNIQWQVISYWQMNGYIPQSMPNIQIDSQTGSPYIYEKTNAMTFKICAEFNKESRGKTSVRFYDAYPAKVIMPNENWEHGTGLQCFDRTIDPIAYPTQVRG